MDLQTLANLAQIIGAAAVVAAIVFGIAQIRQFRLQRQAEAAAELVRSFQDSDFTRSFRLISALPKNASSAELRVGGPAMEDAALALGIRYEAVGLLVFRGIMPLSLVEQLIGAVSIELWSKMRAWVEAVREEQSRPHFLEWFQWLAEQLEKRGRHQQTPAYLGYRNWRPPPE
jgi:hypothetical protein